MTQINTELVAYLNNSLQVTLPEKISLEELQEILGTHINQLIQKDFEKLVSLLYRIDVSENKLKNLLSQYADENAGKIIALLIIERQQEKINSRKQFSKKDDVPDEDEKW